MDFDAKATEALESRMRLVNELRSIDTDKSLTDAAKAERSERLEADILALEGEARKWVEQGERESEVRDLSDRAKALRAPDAGEVRSDAKPSVFDELRKVALGEQREMTVDLRAAGANTSITTDAANAGNTVGKTFATEVIEAMRVRSNIFGLARIVTTASGEAIQWPLKTTQRPTAAVVAEGAAYGKGEGAFSTFTLNATKYGVIVEATREMLNDSLLGLESILAQDAGEGVADKVSTDAVAKLLTQVSVMNGAGAALAADDLIKLQYGVIAPYRNKGAYLVNDATLQAVRLFKDTTGQYLWQPSYQAGQPDLVAGKPIYTDPNLPVAAAGDGSKKIVLFGDFSKFIIRQVAGVNVTRSDEYGFDSDIVAWKVNWRGDFGLSDTAAVTAFGDAA